MNKEKIEQIATARIKEHFNLGAPKLLSLELKDVYIETNIRDTSKPGKFAKRKAWVARFEKICPECGKGWYEVVIDDKTGGMLRFDETW